jgi:uracil-DNA glycosylase
MRNCAPLLKRTLEIVGPVVVAALGKDAWYALCQVFSGLGRPMSDKLPVEIRDGPALFALGHPGYWGTRGRPLEQQVVDWQRLGAWLQASRHRATPK